MKDDSVSRAAVLNLIEQSCCDLEYDCDNVALRKGVEALPPAQRGWIPVTERLPKKDGDYLVTTHSGQIARYIFIGGSSEEYWRRCATAWMPLPTPYREGGKDGQN